MNASTTTTKARRLAAALDDARKRLGLGTLDTRGRDALDFHSLGVASIRDAIESAFNAGFAAAKGAPVPFTFDPSDPGAMLDTLELTERKGRATGGTWVSGTMGGHAFGALVFAEHAESASYELDRSRISKLYISDGGGHEVAAFDRGWDRQPTTDAAKAIVDLLAAGLAELIFGK